MPVAPHLAPALALVLALSGPVLAQSAAPESRGANPWVGPALADLVYGAYCAQTPQEVEPAPDTASGTINIVPGIPNFQFRQKIIPAEIGIGFGVLAYAPPGIVMDPVTAIVTHPPYPDSGISVESWQTDIDDGPNLMGFSFDHASELVLGEWTFSAVTPEGEELFFISFEVVAPELMPQIIRTCFGSFTS